MEISTLFITNEKLTVNKAEILDFCDSIQDLVATMPRTTEGFSAHDQESNQSSNRMEIFDFNSEPSDAESMSVDDVPQSSRGSGRVRRGVTRGGVEKKARKLKTILESSESSGYEFLNQIDNSSRSSWSEA